MSAIGIVLAGKNAERLSEKIACRAVAAMPVGGNYRAIDFTLSSMSHSGIKKIGVITQYNSRSLRDHLNSSKWWDLGRKNAGLYVFTPTLTMQNPYWGYRGTADAIFQNYTFLRKSIEEYVVIANGEEIYNIDFNEVIAYHVEKGSDITLVYTEQDPQRLGDYGVVLLDEDKRVLDYEDKPLDPFSNCVSTGLFVISRTLLMRLLKEVILEEKFDLINDVILRNRRKLRIFGYPYTGYWKPINSIGDYFEVNMDLLEEEVQDSLFPPNRVVYTKIKDEPPAKYNPMAKVTNSIVPCGCIIDSKVENSVLFRSVRIGQNSIIKNSIIMEGTYIGNNCVIENAVIDKSVVVSDGNHIIGTPERLSILGKETVI